MIDTRLATGLLAGLASALIGGAWQVVTRQSTTTTLGPPGLALLRYGVPCLLLLPVLWRTGLLPRGVPRRLLLVMVLGAGLPFGLVAMSGTRFAPAAHMGVMMAGAAPLFTAGLSWLLWRDKPEPARALGLAAMALGVLLLGAPALARTGPVDVGTWRGDALFLLAAALWAGFTLAFRRSGLTAWQGAALINAWSALGLLLWLPWPPQAALAAAPAADVAWQLLWQGLVAGVLGLWTFAAAVTRLGAARAASFGALAPVVSALGGWWWLGETLQPLDLLAVACAVAGVLLASGALSRRSADPGPPAYIR